MVVIHVVFHVCEAFGDDIHILLLSMASSEGASSCLLFLDCVLFAIMLTFRNLAYLSLPDLVVVFSRAGELRQRHDRATAGHVHFVEPVLVPHKMGVHGVAGASALILEFGAGACL